MVVTLNIATYIWAWFQISRFLKGMEINTGCLVEAEATCTCISNNFNLRFILDESKGSLFYGLCDASAKIKDKTFFPLMPWLNIPE